MLIANSRASGFLIDDYAFAAWMTSLMDASRDRRALVELPDVADFDAMHAAVLRAVEIARRVRPDVQARVLPAQRTSNRPAPMKVMLELHEHLFAGGWCVRGCGERRDVA